MMMMVMVNALAVSVWISFICMCDHDTFRPDCRRSLPSPYVFLSNEQPVSGVTLKSAKDNEVKLSGKNIASLYKIQHR